MSLVQHSEDLQVCTSRVQLFFLDFIKFLERYDLTISFKEQVIRMYSNNKLVYYLDSNMFDKKEAVAEGLIQINENPQIIDDLLNLLDKYTLYMCSVHPLDENDFDSYICFANDKEGKYFEVYNLPSLNINVETIRKNFWDMKSIWKGFELCV